ncbi:MAG: preprotein translocase subunit SecA [Clostridiales bacterium]|nr:preprotein translocase subunit SecA [Clostridiales bacterium]
MGLFSYLANGTNRRNIKRLDKQADEVLALEAKYAAMDEEELKAQTAVLKDRLQEIEARQAKTRKGVDESAALDEILPDAFALVREAAWRVMKMRHYKVQIMGGIVLHQGRVAEMKTGEGKTLTSTLPAYLNALTGKGVHIVTVNEYLAERDAVWMGKIYRYLGLSVGCILHDMSEEEKQKAYRADITYGTNNEMGFDYLRDNLKTEMKAMLQRELQFAIVDEVDSILIDEARTPLIISGKGDKSSELYYSANRFVKTLRAEEDFTVDVKEKTVQITEDGARKAEKFFKIDNLGDIEHADLNHHLQQALKAHYIFKKDNDYVVSDGEIIIVDEFTGRLMIGRRYSEGLHQAIEAKENVPIRNENKTFATITFQNYFRLYHKLSGMTGTAKTEEEEFRSIYALDVVEIPTNVPVVRKDMPDCIYSTVKGKQRAIINEIVERHKTGQPILVGTITVEKSEELSRLLVGKGVRHNVLNAKNHEREAEIVAQAGRLGAVTIATNMAGRGTDILLGGNPEYMAKAKLRAKGTPNELIELATSYLTDIGEEAQVVREEYNKLHAEFKKQTDEEKKKVMEVGGLCIIGSERHESRRIDNQLRGRSGRQGDEGTSVFFISLEDELAIRFGGERMQRIYSFFKIDEDTCIQSRMLSRSVENAQRNIEGKNFAIRRQVLEYDNVMNVQRAVIYKERNKVLKGENVHEDILKLIPDYVHGVLAASEDLSVLPASWNLDRLNKNIEDKLLPKDSDFFTPEMQRNCTASSVEEKLLKATVEAYEEKIANYKEEGFDYHEFERQVMLKTVDSKWIDHIDAMDQLRRGIGLRAYGNDDPILAYKREGFAMFDELIESIQHDTIQLLLKAEIRKAPVKRVEEDLHKGPVTARSNKVGRNSPCPCGSGRKYKDCCGKNA